MSLAELLKDLEQEKCGSGTFELLQKDRSGIVKVENVLEWREEHSALRGRDDRFGFKLFVGLRDDFVFNDVSVDE